MGRFLRFLLIGMSALLGFSLYYVYTKRSKITLLPSHTSPITRSDTVIVFDFDGTIADSIPYAINAFNAFSEKYEYEKISDGQIEELRHLGFDQVIKRVGLSYAKLPFLVRDIRTHMHNVIKEVKPFDGIVDTLDDLRGRGVRLGILSTNSEKNVRLFLQLHNIDSIEFLVGGSSIFGKDKMLKKVLKELSIIPSQVTYVGDEVRDIVAAKVVDIRSAAVSWGYNHEELLSEHAPDFLCMKPKDLLQLVS